MWSPLTKTGKNHRVWRWKDEFAFSFWLLRGLPSGDVLQASENTGLNLALFLYQTFEVKGLIAMAEGEEGGQGCSFGIADL